MAAIVLDRLSNAAAAGREELIAASLPLLEAVRVMTAGTDAERWLNREHGPGSVRYETLARIIKTGVAEGWAASESLDGAVYRRSRIVEPSERTFHFSITAVYMDSTRNAQGNPEDAYRGQYHAHPYGEFNMVVPLDDKAALAGPNGWCHGGWTAPSPGSHHYPEAKGGAVIALFYLPAGRITYISPPEASLPAKGHS